MGVLKREVVKWIRLLVLFFVKLPFEIVLLFTGRFLSKSVDDYYTKMLGSVLPGSPEENYAGSVYGLGYIKQMLRSRFLEITKPAQLGQDAPNSEIISLEDRSLHTISDFAKKDRPLVLNFGSCT